MNVKPTVDGLANLILPALVMAYNNHRLTNPRDIETLRREAVAAAIEIRKALAVEIDGYADIRQEEAGLEAGLEESILLRGEERALRDLASLLRGDKTRWEKRP